jgi:hypothetical protein
MRLTLFIITFNVIFAIMVAYKLAHYTESGILIYEELQNVSARQRVQKLRNDELEARIKALESNR